MKTKRQKNEKNTDMDTPEDLFSIEVEFDSSYREKVLCYLRNIVSILDDHDLSGSCLVDDCMKQVKTINILPSQVDIREVISNGRMKGWHDEENTKYFLDCFNKFKGDLDNLVTIVRDKVRYKFYDYFDDFDCVDDRLDYMKKFFRKGSKPLIATEAYTGDTIREDDFFLDAYNRIYAMVIDHLIEELDIETDMWDSRKNEVIDVISEFWPENREGTLKILETFLFRKHLITNVKNLHGESKEWFERNTKDCEELCNKNGHEFVEYVGEFGVSTMFKYKCGGCHKIVQTTFRVMKLSEPIKCRLCAI
jgi:DNA-directed RNA polymerase subunit RPC12/RpoP